MVVSHSQRDKGARSRLLKTSSNGLLAPRFQNSCMVEVDQNTLSRVFAGGMHHVAKAKVTMSYSDPPEKAQTYQ